MWFRRWTTDWLIKSAMRQRASMYKQNHVMWEIKQKNERRTG